MLKLPRLPRRRPLWQRDALVAGRAAGTFAVQFAGGIALGLAAMAIADTVTTSPTARQLIAIALVVVGVVGARVAWIVRRKKRRGRRNPSTNSQAHNQWTRGLGSALSRRFRRG